MQSCSRLININIPQPRPCWSYPKEEYWFQDMWDNRCVANYQGNRWKQDFRMNGETFEKLVIILAPQLRKEDTSFRRAIPIENG